jgi:hypothetical protein
MFRRPTPSGWRSCNADVVIRFAILALAVATPGCGGLLSSDSAPGVGGDVWAAVRALRVRVLDDMAFVAEGDTDPRLNALIKPPTRAPSSISVSALLAMAWPFLSASQGEQQRQPGQCGIDVSNLIDGGVVVGMVARGMGMAGRRARARSSSGQPPGISKMALQRPTLPRQ